MELARGRDGLAGALSPFEPYSIVVVPFPFVDRAVARRRPALVVSSAAFNSGHPASVLAMITTARACAWLSDVVLQDWHSAGLTVACRVRLKLFTLDVALILDRRGVLSPRDRQAVE
jgi:mRNA interferase MazF